MDIVAHSLWAGAGVVLLRRHVSIAPRTGVLTVTLAALPDVLQVLPVLAWWAFGGGSFAAVRAFAIAVPGQEPLLPSAVSFLSYNLHCMSHSAIVAGLVTLLVWRLRRSLWIPLLGWWSHIVIDVFTHSADYYASPVLYPITQRGFDGIAWNTPWFMALNYLALSAVGLWLLLGIRRRRDRSTLLAEGARGSRGVATAPPTIGATAQSPEGEPSCPP